MSPSHRFGFVAIVGRPNVGKSTLLNALVGEKVSIVSAKPHTTRHRILGVVNRGASQAVFIDTPGHLRRTRGALHRLMARVVHQALEDADVSLLLIEATGPTRADLELFELIGARAGRVVLVLNKIDRLRRTEDLLPVIDGLKRYGFLAYVPISATSGRNLPALVDTIVEHLPEGEAMFPSDMPTDRDILFRSAEIVREKLLARLHQEVPYGLTVEVEHLQRDDDGRWRVHALIWLDKESHKPIVIGKGGQTLKQVGQEARKELAQLLGDRVHLELWAKVREHWSDSERELKRLGFE